MVRVLALGGSRPNSTGPKKKKGTRAPWPGGARKVAALGREDGRHTMTVELGRGQLVLEVESKNYYN